MGTPWWEMGSLYRPDRSSWVGALRDAALVAVAATAVIGLTRTGWARWTLEHPEMSLLLALVSAALAMATAVLWSVVRRLTASARAGWVTAALITYALVAIPATMVGSVLEVGRGMTGAVRLIAHLVVAVMLLAAGLGWPGSGRRTGLRSFGLGLAAVTAAAVLGAVFPAQAVAFAGFEPLRVGLVATLVLAGVAIVWRAITLGTGPGVRTGLGIVLLALAHGYRIGTEAAQSSALPGLTFSTLRVLALLLMVIGVIQMARAALHGFGQARGEREQQLRMAELDLARRAELDLELRVRVAELVTTAEKLDATPDPDERAARRAELNAELRRLDKLLDMHQVQNRIEIPETLTVSAEPLPRPDPAAEPELR